MNLSTVVPIYGWINGLQPTPLPGRTPSPGSLMEDKSVRNYFPETWLMVNLTTG